MVAFEFNEGRLGYSTMATHITKKKIQFYSGTETQPTGGYYYLIVRVTVMKVKSF